MEYAARKAWEEANRARSEARAAQAAVENAKTPMSLSKAVSSAETAARNAKAAADTAQTNANRAVESARAWANAGQGMTADGPEVESPTNNKTSCVGSERMPEPGPPPDYPLEIPQYWDSESEDSKTKLPQSIRRIREEYGCKSGEYCREAAVEYARRWAGEIDLDNTGTSIDYAVDYFFNSGLRNGAFYNYSTNCANFVSQCILAGGLEMTEEWHTNPTSRAGFVERQKGNQFTFSDTGPAWRLANNQCDYFKEQYNNLEIINKKSTGEDAQEIKKAIRNHQIQPGDLLYFTHIDKNGNEIVNHATIITSVDDENIYYAGNSISRFDQPLSTTLASDEYVRVVIIHIGG